MDRRCYSARVVKYGQKLPRVSRARDTAPVYGGPPEDQADQPLSVYHVIVDERGRVMLPAEVRARLKIRQGDKIGLIFETDGTMSLKTKDVALNNLRGMFKHLAPKNRYASDDLIAERRREARKEEQEFRERTALHRRMVRERLKRQRRER